MPFVTQSAVTPASKCSPAAPPDEIGSRDGRERRGIHARSDVIAGMRRLIVSRVLPCNRHAVGRIVHQRHEPIRRHGGGRVDAEVEIVRGCAR